MSNLFKFPSTTGLKGSPNDGPFKDGDTIIILRANGTTGLVTVGIDKEALIEKLQRDEELTEIEQSYVDTSSRAFALYSAALSPKIMAALIEVTEQPDFVDQDLLDKFPKLN